MDSYLILKNALRESRLFKNRVIVAWLVVVILIGLLVARLVFLQVHDHDHFTTLSKNNWLKIIPSPPPRGFIYDRNGVVLAENQTSYSLEIVPEKVPDMEAMLATLREIVLISDSDIERFRRAVKRKRRFDQIPLRFRLSEEEVARLSVRNHALPGIVISANLTRSYPLGQTGVHAIGYVGRINEEELKDINQADYSGTQYIGKTGVEKSYEAELHGTVGVQEVETNVMGRVLRVVKRVDPTPGANIYLNLDVALQSFAERLLEGERGALVALDPKSGGVLAMVSIPGYDPNPFVNGIDADSYRELQHSPDRPLFNRVLRGQYPPGSTVKAFVGLAGLEYGVRTPESRTWCPGWFSLKNDNHKYRDWKKTGHGHMDFFHAVEQSCDVYFYALAQDLGIDRLSGFMHRFSFGEKTGIDISGELTGIMPDRAWKNRRLGTAWYPGETLITGIGQGFTLATPLQLAMATATLSMRGQAYLPRLVFAIEEANLQQMRLVSSQAPTQVSIRDPVYWQTAIDGMEAVIHGSRGTAGKQARGLKYRMAGKTGTAQVVRIKQGESYNAKKLAKKYHDHALFVAFAPVDDPKIAVAVIVENGGSGSYTAAPIARQVIDYYLIGRLGMFGGKYEPPPPVEANKATQH